VRVKIATLSVDMADGDSASHDDVGRNIHHTLAVQSSLELGAHESVTLTRIAEAEEVNGEHGEIESGGDDDETEESGHEVLEPEALRVRFELVNVPKPVPMLIRARRIKRQNTYNRDILAVAEKHPKLHKSQRSDPGNGE
jgi:hypothetical protein